MDRGDKAMESIYTDRQSISRQLIRRLFCLIEYEIKEIGLPLKGISYGSASRSDAEVASI